MTRVVIDVPEYKNIKSEVRLREHRRLNELMKKHTPKKGFILDFGCGLSYYTGNNAIGIDLNKKLLFNADLGGKVLADYNHPPFQSRIFDAIYMVHSIEHTNDARNPLREANRLLKKNGTIGITFPNIRGLRNLFQIVFRGINVIGGHDHLACLTPKMIEHALNETGFTKIDEGGDIIYTPYMERLRLMKLGYWMADRFPTWAGVYIIVAKKRAPSTFEKG